MASRPPVRTTRGARVAALTALSTAAAACLVLAPVPAHAAVHEAGTAQQLRDALVAAGETPGADTIRLVGDIPAGSGTFVIPTDAPVTLDLAGHDLFAGGGGRDFDAGIRTLDAVLVIADSAGGGTLTATGGLGSPGIGSPTGYPGSVTITGGTVIASGGANAAGIGAAGGDDGGSVTITGGTVTATGLLGSAGIGGGSGGDGGSVTITGGTVTAIASPFTTGSSGGAGIGGGRRGAGGSVTISGGTVSAVGSQSAAGIGGGGFGAGASVTITGGTVTATGGDDPGRLEGPGGGGAGIGGGYLGAAGPVTISGGTVTATGGLEAAGIGGGHEGAAAQVTIGAAAVVVASHLGNGGSTIGPGTDGDGAAASLVNAGDLTLHDKHTVHGSFVNEATGVVRVTGRLAGSGGPIIANHGTVLVGPAAQVIGSEVGFSDHAYLVGYDLDGHAWSGPDADPTGTRTRVLAASFDAAAHDLPTPPDGLKWVLAPDGAAVEAGTDLGALVGPKTLAPADWSGDTWPANVMLRLVPVVVPDTTAPEVYVPGDLTTAAVDGSGVDVEWDAPSARDLVDGWLPVSCDRASGSRFPIGTTTVTCTATDAAGNTGTASFSVTVADQQSPVIAVPEELVVEATGPDGAEVELGVNAVDAVDGPVEVTCDPASGSAFALGTTEVACTASDATGNQTEASFTVRVVDTTAPVLALPDDLTVPATSAAGAEVDAEATATDVVDQAVEATCEPALGGVFPVGTTDVTCEATDAAGNIGTGGFTVTVTDEDSDGDGLLDREEALSGRPCVDGAATDPADPDTDGDGYTDGQEMSGVRAALRIHTRRGATWLRTVRTDPCARDSDGDGIGDARELTGRHMKQKVIVRTAGGGRRTFVIGLVRTDPTRADTDRDGLGDAAELAGIMFEGRRVRTDPGHWNTDLGNGGDRYEVNHGSNPVDAFSRPSR